MVDICRKIGYYEAENKLKNKIIEMKVANKIIEKSL